MPHKLLKALFCYLAWWTCAASSNAAELATAFPKEPPPLTLEARLGRPFGDHAVFQQRMAVPIWGWTLPGATVQVTFGEQERSATAGADGRWALHKDYGMKDVVPSGPLYKSHQIEGRVIRVKFDYAQHPLGCNLYNKHGLAVAPFSTCGY